ncbi:hypothetical protein FOCG_02601 [Fusarium oxysporum f. sp. radicis-lycopersici 26381]|uniref:Uncharacterized protein n=4 Tax=Fusarium oxysporum TaxID=5507 RepID=W9IMV3_FUSOX|nr:hypothetical protein FOXG_19222 [Fusarium oxysporum f. sp. lycopersici 4287]EWY95952.1 hypothetical protein FOYG_04827 [Fusarium oxysporum NRRL 32931]EWZ42245.1 hypothetical protein FOZG_07244 [Fusarium oxysporum Fo47]EXA00659.1 hypothetical protein FOWG_00801 [Fusarium oxysporum f. sp. lycopersici MN25]EXK35383.1 hypothetical protein FOMG_10530 [Fusarium oxysporum f. sp. melonis 26406]EXL59343.1 hypothetical protein FOCG_02601 [Fusarium oxysporum f. sp. radicis-lycopersici 26381]
MDGRALSLQIVGRNQLLYGAGGASWRQGAWARLKSTKALRSLDDDETKSAEGCANW